MTVQWKNTLDRSVNIDVNMNYAHYSKTRYSNTGLNVLGTSRPRLNVPGWIFVVCLYIQPSAGMRPLLQLLLNNKSFGVTLHQSVCCSVVIKHCHVGDPKPRSLFSQIPTNDFRVAPVPGGHLSAVVANLNITWRKVRKSWVTAGPILFEQRP